jgi:opacity protein-like surface antigen
MLRTLSFCILLATLGTSSAMADPPGFYVGAGVGQATIKNDYAGYHQHDLGFNLTAGIRPLPLLGAEISYVDLGNRGYDGYWNCFGNCGNDNHIREQGGAAFAVLYLPIPRSLVDIYGKAGVAVLDTRQRIYNGSYCAQCNYYYYDNDQTNTGFAWGAGVQVHWWNFAFRGEFEQFQNQIGRPNLVTAGAFWSF